MKKRTKIIAITVVSIVLFIAIYLSLENNMWVKVDQEGYEDIHVDVNNNKIDVYVRDDHGDYIGYHIIHDERAIDKNKVASNYDVWKINGANQYSRNDYGRFKEELALVTEGEWELAIREEGANDFFGGNAHGDELTQSI